MELHVSLGPRRPGEPVPATRALAARLEVSRNTVMNAYERLIAEGFLVGTHGAGTFVRDQGPPAVRRPAPSALAPRTPSRTVDLARRPAAPFDFRLGAPDPALFPWDERRYDGRPLEPLHALDRAGRVIYVGTFSKVLSPSLRIGFTIAPPTLAPALAAARAIVDHHNPNKTKQTHTTQNKKNNHTHHIRRVLRVYRERRQRLC